MPNLVLNWLKRRQKLMLQAVYGDGALSRSSVFVCFERSKDGRPSTTRKADTYANVREMVARYVDGFSE
jgi:hypothetical protein